MKYYEKTISSRMMYNGKVINLRIDEVQLPDNNQSFREVVEHLICGVLMYSQIKGKLCK